MSIFFETDNLWLYHGQMEKSSFCHGRIVNSIFFNFFPEKFLNSVKFTPIFIWSKSDRFSRRYPQNLCASHHASEADCTHFWEIWFSFKTKISTGQLSCLAFQLSIEWAFLVDIPIDQFYFLKRRDIDSSSHRFMAMYDKRLGLGMK